jgi:hypothetical protein
MGTIQTHLISLKSSTSKYLRLESSNTDRKMMDLSPTKQVCSLWLGDSKCLLFLEANPRVVVLAVEVQRLGCNLMMPIMRIKTAAMMRVLMSPRARS